MLDKKDTLSRFSKECRTCGFPFRYSLLAFTILTPARLYAQEVPQTISPLQVETDINGVNIVTGKKTFETPVLAIPAAPNLRFDRVSNAAPYFVGSSAKGRQGETTLASGSYSIHTIDGKDDTFRCVEGSDCSTLMGSGSTFSPITKYYRQFGSGALYTFNLRNLQRTVNTANTYRIDVQYYASSIAYPNGETISFQYDSYSTSSGGSTIIFYRPSQISSNLGYYISVSYKTSAQTPEWFTATEATLFANSNASQPLGRLTFNGQTVRDIAGRVFQCSSCSTANLGPNQEAAFGTVTLPSETNSYISVESRPDYPLISSVIKDSTAWSYAYSNIRYNTSYSGILYDSVTVTGPDGYNKIYTITPKAPFPGSGSIQNVISATTDSLGRSAAILTDGLFRPKKISYPEGNSVEVAYDRYGNIINRIAHAKPGSGLSDVSETAAIDPNCTGVLCYRPIHFSDGLGRQTDYVYNDKGQIVEQTDFSGGNGITRKTYTAYETGALSRRSSVRMCELGVACGAPGEIRTEYGYWQNTFLPSSVRKVDTITGTTLETTYRYDAAGRVLSEDGPITGTDDAFYYRYDIIGRKIMEIGAKGISNGVRQAKRYTYRDADDKVVALEIGYVTDPYGTFNVLKRVDTSYDSRRDPVRQATSSGSTTYSVTDTSYDGQGKAVCEAVRMNSTAFGSLPGDACTLGPSGSDGPDRVTRNTYDAAGQLLLVQKAYGTALQQDYVAYTYTANGKRASVRDANGNLAAMTYDGFDRQSAWNFPSTTTTGQVSTSDYEAYGYDLVGNRTSVRKRDGRTIAFTYDNLNRVTSKTYPQGGARAVYYSYDVRGLQTAARFDSAAGSDAVTATWDGLGRRTTSTTAMGGISRTLTYGYDANGARTRITYPDAAYVDYNREATGKLYYASVNGGTPLFYPIYDSAGRVSTLYRGIAGNWGAPSNYGYDGVDRLTTLTHDLTGAAGDAAWTFSYNAAGQIGSQSRDNDAYAFTGYATVDRSYAVNGLNQYTSAGPASFAYDANGSLTGDGTTSYSYDIENRLVSASNGSQLTWDPLGRLFQINGAASGTTQFLYDADAMVAEYDGAGNVVNRYVHSDGDDDPLVWYQGSSTNSPRYLYADQIGSIVAVADSNGNLVMPTGYDEYGIASHAGNVIAPFGRFGFTGQAWLRELGMYHYKARIYSPTLGRFLQTDPIGYADQINLYTYVANDPVNGRDPTGMYDCAGSKGECRAVAALAKGLDAAANSRKISSDQRATLRSASDALGKAGDHNGVTVNFQDLGKTADGKLIMGQADASSNTLTLNTNAILQVAGSQGWKSAFVAGVGAVGHEVRHLQDGSVPNGDYNKRMTTETNGYGVSSSVNQAFGMPGMNGRQIQNGAVASCAQATGQFSACQDSSRHLYPGEYR